MRHTVESRNVDSDDGKNDDGSREIGGLVGEEHGTGMVVKTSSTGAEGDAFKVILDHSVSIDNGSGIADLDTSCEQAQESQEGFEESSLVRSESHRQQQLTRRRKPKSCRSSSRQKYC